MTYVSPLGMAKPVNPAAYNRLIKNLPWGIEVLATLSTDVSGIVGTFVDVVTSTAIDVPAGRRFKIHAQVHIQSTVADDIPELRITDTSNTIIPFGQVRGPALRTANKLYGATITAVDSTGTGGSRQWKLRCFRETGTGNLTVSNATINGLVLVEDIGPA